MTVTTRAPNNATRRAFLKSLSAAAIISAWGCAGPQRLSPNERIRVGFVGLGGRGYVLLRQFYSQPDVDIVALCDVQSEHYRDRPWGQGTAFGHHAAKAALYEAYASEAKSRTRPEIRLYSDYRVLCAQSDIDAVVIATPDHWHALCTLDALEHRKDVYCEKPLTHTFREGRLVYRAAKKSGSVFQVGSQQRSAPEFRRAAELVRNGHIGPVRLVEVGLPAGYAEPMGNTTVENPPDNLDYDMWTGPAEKLPYMRARHHRWWRGHTAYGGGNIMDWIGHHNDIAHWALDLDDSGPAQVEAVDWVYPNTDIYNVPNEFTIRCAYANSVESTISSRNATGTKWLGDDGWVHVDRGILKASDKRWLADDFNVGDKHVYHSPGHVRDFLDSMRTRDECIAPPETGHRAITPGHLAFVSQTLGRPLNWDPQREAVIGDKEAQRLLNRVEYRHPWKLT